MDDEYRLAEENRECEEERRWQEAQDEHEQYEIDANNELYGKGNW